jgi:hypothetical protein
VCWAAGGCSEVRPWGRTQQDRAIDSSRMPVLHDGVVLELISCAAYRAERELGYMSYRGSPTHMR